MSEIKLFPFFLEALLRFWPIHILSFMVWNVATVDEAPREQISPALIFADGDFLVLVYFIIF